MINKDVTKWGEITTDEAFKLSQAEFKGTVLQALKDLNDRLTRIENQNDQRSVISMAIAGIVGGIAGLFGGNFK